MSASWSGVYPHRPARRSVWSQIAHGLWYGSAVGVAFVLSVIVDEVWI